EGGDEIRDGRVLRRSDPRGGENPFAPFLRKRNLLLGLPQRQRRQLRGIELEKILVAQREEARIFHGLRARDDQDLPSISQARIAPAARGGVVAQLQRGYRLGPRGFQLHRDGGGDETEGARV